MYFVNTFVSKFGMSTKFAFKILKDFLSFNSIVLLSFSLVKKEFIKLLINFSKFGYFLCLSNVFSDENSIA